MDITAPISLSLKKAVHMKTKSRSIHQHHFVNPRQNYIIAESRGKRKYFSETQCERRRYPGNRSGEISQGCASPRSFCCADPWNTVQGIAGVTTIKPYINTARTTSSPLFVDENPVGSHAGKGEGKGEIDERSKKIKEGAKATEGKMRKWKDECHQALIAKEWAEQRLKL